MCISWECFMLALQTRSQHDCLCCGECMEQVYCFEGIWMTASGLISTAHAERCACTWGHHGKNIGVP